MAARAKRTPRKAAKAPKASRAKPAAPPAAREDVQSMLRDLAVLTAVNNLMAQTAFLTVERLRISTEVVDERITNDFGAQLFERCEAVTRASDDLVLRLLDEAGAHDERADLVRALVGMRREFASKSLRPVEQPRLHEALERMYR